MTPKREKYLAKCSEKEKLLRWKLKEAKQVLRTYKFAQNRKREVYPFPLTEAQIIYIKKMIRESKTLVNAYRHELNRLKEWTECVPEVVSYKEFEGVCKCGNDVTDFDFYCSRCGRKLLWKKVK